eukprot:PhF_6_TR22297/c0_g1_i2/m.31552
MEESIFENPVLLRYVSAKESDTVAPCRVLYFLSLWSYDVTSGAVPSDCIDEMIECMIPISKPYLQRKAEFMDRVSHKDVVEVAALVAPPEGLRYSTIHYSAVVARSSWNEDRMPERQTKKGIRESPYRDVTYPYSVDWNLTRNCVRVGGNLEKYTSNNEFTTWSIDQLKDMYIFLRTHLSWFPATHASLKTSFTEYILFGIQLFITYMEVLHPLVVYNCEFIRPPTNNYSTPIAPLKFAALKPLVTAWEHCLAFGDAHKYFCRGRCSSVTSPDTRVAALFKKITDERGIGEYLGKTSTQSHYSLCSIYRMNYAIHNTDELKDMTWEDFDQYSTSFEALHMPQHDPADEPASTLLRIQYEYLRVIYDYGKTVFDRTPGSSRMLFAEATKGLPPMGVTSRLRKQYHGGGRRPHVAEVYLYDILSLLIGKPNTLSQRMTGTIEWRAARNYGLIMKRRRDDVESKILRMMDEVLSFDTSNVSGGEFLKLKNYYSIVIKARAKYVEEGKYLRLTF